MKNKFAVIVAGGDGRRAGGGLPKQFRMLEGIPMLWWSVRAFHKEDPSTKIILVIHPAFLDIWHEIHSSLSGSDLTIPIKVVAGGKNRLESVINGLAVIPDDERALVAVHDAARPVISPDMIGRGWKAGEEYHAAVPVDAMTDSIRELIECGSRAAERSRYVKVQTPQVFDASLLKAAYAGPLSDSMTDDASVAEAYGVEIGLYEGESTNIKVTHPLDVDIASLLIHRLGL